MSAELDALLKDMNDELAGRPESEVGLSELYWKKRAAYQQAYHAADKVHIPVGEEVEEIKEEGTDPFSGLK